MPLTPSQATPEECVEYSEGSCHYLALALHQKLGWEMSVQIDQAEHFWEDEADGDNYLPAVLHVYAIDPNGQAWDIHGRRPQDEIREDIEARFSPMEPDSDDCRSEGELRCYVGEWADAGEDPIERPLHTYTQEDLDRAWQVAVRVFDGMAGFIPAVPVSAPRPGR